MIPENVQIGDVFERRGGHSHMVFIGKVTPENVQTFLGLNIRKNNNQVLEKLFFSERPLVFIVFDRTDDALFIENISHDFDRVVSRIVNFKYSHSQEKVEKIVNKMKKENEKMKMEVGKVYKLVGWNGVAICLERSPDLKFKNLEKFTQSNDVSGIYTDPMDAQFMCLLYDLNINRGTVLSFYNNEFQSSNRISITSQLNDFDFQNMASPWREIVLDIFNTVYEKKCFRINKTTKEIHCFEGQAKVKWAKENDKRQFITMGCSSNELFEKNWPILNIDFPTYLLLTGLSERTKEDELLEIKEKILSADSLGCQKDGLKSIGEEFISLLHKIQAYDQKFKKDIINTLMNTLRILSPNDQIAENGYRKIVEELLARYVAKLKEKN